jgi:hypothetical protein
VTAAPASSGPSLPVSPFLFYVGFDVGLVAYGFACWAVSSCADVERFYELCDPGEDSCFCCLVFGGRLFRTRDSEVSCCLSAIGMLSVLLLRYLIGLFVCASCGRIAFLDEMFKNFGYAQFSRILDVACCELGQL